MKHWSERFLSSTRGRVVQLLRREAASVNDLAEALDLTDNAIRSHLSRLQRDRLVREAGKRPGVRKPETLYALTREAEQLFPKAYPVLLNELLRSLSTRLSADELEGVLREVGERLAGEQPAPADSEPLRSRAERALEVLKQMGGLAELEEDEERFIIRGYSCPLAASVDHHPQVCLLAEALLSEVVGVPVREQCVRNGRPRCVFHILQQLSE